MTPASTLRSPLVDEAGVTFVYRAQAGERDIRVTGDFAPDEATGLYWSETGIAMRPTGAGSTYAAHVELPRSARIEYEYIVDGESRLDPLNPRVVFSGVGGGSVSELAMPDYEAPGVLGGPSPLDGGDVSELRGAPPRTRVWVYTPAGYDPAGAYPVIYTADGSAWLKYMELVDVLDRSIARGRVQPVLAVLIDPETDRGAWYAAGSGFVDYVASVVQRVDAEYATSPARQHRLHLGTSAGARATLRLALERPDLFGKVAALSPSVKLTVPSRLGRVVSGEEPIPEGVEFWLSAGRYESFIAEFVQALEARLVREGATVRTKITHEGHSFEAWKNRSAWVLENAFPQGGHEAAPRPFRPRVAE